MYICKADSFGLHAKGTELVATEGAKVSMPIYVCIIQIAMASKFGINMHIYD